MSESIGVSKSAVYDKLNRLEPNVSKTLVKSTTLELTTIIHQLGAAGPELGCLFCGICPKNVNPIFCLVVTACKAVTTRDYLEKRTQKVWDFFWQIRDKVITLDQSCCPDIECSFLMA